MSAAGRYAETIRVPRVARLLAVGTIGRLPAAMDFIALVLFVRELTGSYAIAGGVTATFTVGYGGSAPLQARLSDRYGPSRVLWFAALAHTVAMGALVGAGLGGAPGYVLIALGLFAGATIPPLGPIVRQMLARTVPDRRDLLPSIFGIDALCGEFVFMSGPAVTAVVIIVASPQAALLAACAITLIGVAGLTTMPAPAAPEPEKRRSGGGALRSPGLRTLIGCAFPVGMTFGTFQVAVVAFADHVDDLWSAPWLMMLLSVGGVCGAFAYGALGHRAASSAILAVAACALPMFLAPILLATSVVQIAPLVVLGGIVLTPVFAIINQIVGDVAPAGAETESYAWVFMATLTGGSVGLTVGGAIIDAGGWRAGVSFAIAATVLTAIVAVTRRRTLPDLGWERAGPEAA